MRSQISLLLLSIFLYLNFDGTDGQCPVPTLTAPLQWSGTAPTTDIADGGTATVECPDGYTVTGTATLSCTGTTLSALPTCTPNNCTDPGAAPENGQKTGDTFTHGSTVNYTCNDGYTLSGPGVLTCSLGSWNNEVPTCAEGEPTTEAAPTEADSGESGAGVAMFDYIMIPAVILAAFSK